MTEVIDSKADSVSSRLLAGLFAQRRTGKFCDVKIHIGNTCLWAHSCVLSTFSSRLYDAFVNLDSDGRKQNRKHLNLYKNWSLNKPLEIFLSDFGAEEGEECLKCVDKVVDFLYNGRIAIDHVDHIGHVERLGKLLQINELDEVCQEARMKLKEDVPEEETELLIDRDKEKCRKTQLAGGKPYSCLACGSKQRTVAALLQHLREPSHENTSLDCSLCLRYTAKSESDLRLHLALHDHSLPFFCASCDARFRTRTALSSHEPRHSTQTPFLCGKCGKGFKWKHALINHELVHSDEKRHLCDTCGFSTAHVSTFRAHKMVHAGVCFKCPVADCQFVATRKQSLMQHIPTHTNQKQYQCEICGQSFTMHKNLRRHAAKHEPSPEGLTCCPVPGCLYSNTRLDKIKAHAERHKSGKPVRNSLIPRVRQSKIKKQNTPVPSFLKSAAEPVAEKNFVVVIPMEVAPLVDDLRSHDIEISAVSE
ncbi:zinc finger protein 585B-like [Neocloeon triangulifer]|uniref:zinc finger protein 585B-like n=1 Tax=Neocloeon triangulifer TaxID=2078957 RepID=UPI00286F1A36|nr:zinc finger protein 585B-like [Neocloeon triangulifer]